MSPHLATTGFHPKERQAVSAYRHWILPDAASIVKINFAHGAYLGSRLLPGIGCHSFKVSVPGRGWESLGCFSHAEVAVLRAQPQKPSCLAMPSMVCHSITSASRKLRQETDRICRLFGERLLVRYCFHSSRDPVVVSSAVVPGSEIYLRIPESLKTKQAQAAVVFCERSVSGRDAIKGYLFYFILWQTDFGVLFLSLFSPQIFSQKGIYLFLTQCFNKRLLQMALGGQTSRRRTSCVSRRSVHQADFVMSCTDVGKAQSPCQVPGLIIFFFVRDSGDRHLPPQKSSLRTHAIDRIGKDPARGLMWLSKAQACRR